MADLDVQVLFKPMFDSFNKSMKAAAKAFERFAKAFHRAQPAIRITARRLVTLDEDFIMSDDWKTGECTGWLCDSCPQWKIPSIQCAHTCHGGSVR